MQKILVSIVILLFVAVCIEAHKSGKGGSRNRQLRNPIIHDVELYDWEVEASSGMLITQKAFLSPEGEAVIKTTSRHLKVLNMTASYIYMNPNTKMMAIRGSSFRSPCYLTDLSANQSKIESDFAKWNGTTITMTSNFALNASGPRLTWKEVHPILKANRGMKSFCRKRSLIKTDTVPAGNDYPDAKTLVLLGYDSEISVMIFKKPPSIKPIRLQPRIQGRVLNSRPKPAQDPPKPKPRGRKLGRKGRVGRKG